MASSYVGGGYVGPPVVRVSLLLDVWESKAKFCVGEDVDATIACSERSLLGVAVRRSAQRRPRR